VLLPAEQTLFPTLSYGEAGANGDTFSSSAGTWGNLEFGYNPFSNNLGTSISSGTANTVNVASGESVGTIDPGMITQPGLMICYDLLRSGCQSASHICCCSRFLCCILVLLAGAASLSI
jgi:hypothetical protein